MQSLPRGNKISYFLVSNCNIHFKEDGPFQYQNIKASFLFIMKNALAISILDGIISEHKETFQFGV
jgi:hypothetical protein